MMTGIKILIFCFLASLDVDVSAFDVLMVIGGRYYDHGRNAHIELSSVEVVGPSGTCQVADLPESRHGHSAVRLGDNVVVCGGLSGRHIHERKECFIYSGTTQKWKQIEEPAPAGLAFSGMASHGNCIYIVGGRENLYTGDALERNWKHSPATMEYCTTRKGINAWRFLANLSEPISDGCSAVVDGRLWHVGGEAGVSVLGPGAHKWKEGVAEEPHDYELASIGMKPALQHPLPDLSESPWWEEGQSLNKPPAVPIDAPGQPWQYWQGQVHGAGAGGGYQGQGVPGNVNYSPEQKYSIPGAPTNQFGFNNYNINQQNRKEDLFSGLLSIFGQTSERPNRRYDGNPYSKLRERNKRDVVEEEEKGIEIGETLEIGDAEEFENRNKREVGESGEINKREVGEWRGQITRAPYVRTGQDQVTPPMENKNINWRLQDQRSNINERTFQSERNQQQHVERNKQNERNKYNERNFQKKFNSGDLQRDKKQNYDAGFAGYYPQHNFNKGLNSKPSKSEKPPKVLPVGQGCHTTYLGAELGMFIAGGFQRNGRRVKWLPLGRPGKPMIEELQMMVEPRRWAPAVGSVGDTLVVAGGGNWGSNTIEIFDKNERRWRSGGRLRFRREYSASVVVDSSWFPQCNFTLT